MPRLIRKMAMVLACAMMVETVTPVTAVYAHERVASEAQKTDAAQNTSAKGDLSTTIRFDYPFAYEKVKQHNIKVTLKKGNTNIVEIQLGETQEIVKNTGNYSIEIIPQNTQNVEMTTEDVMGSYYINIKNLELGTYQFVYEGDGYKTYTSKDIILEDYSKNVTVGTGDATFSYGDINGDQEITEDDLKAIEEDIKEGRHEQDINGDGKVDIVELTYVKQQLEATGEEVQTDLAAIITQDVIKAAEDSIKEVGLEITSGNSVADLFTGSNQVKIEKTSGEGKLEIPLDLGEEGIEAQVIEFVSPVTEGGLESGTVIVEYEEDGVIKKEEQTFTTSVEGINFLGRSEGKNTISINLGKRVPVKRVTISVDKIVGEDGAPNYVVMEEVSFVKDIVSNVSPVDKTVIKNVKLTAKDKEMILEWDPVPNVEGYRVFYGETSGKYAHELNVDKPYASVEGLENLKTYYFMVRATSGDWMGTPSEEYKGIPQPSKAPLAPDFLSVKEMNGGLTLSWKAAEDATYYKVFYKESNASDTEYKQFIPSESKEGKITATSAVIGGLTNGVEYDLYVTSGNNIGESRPSAVVTGTAKKVEIEGPVLPSANRISVDEITDVKLLVPRNVDMRFYPNGFNLVYDLSDKNDGIKNVVDGDYATHWTAADWTVSGRIDFTFKNPHEMNYVVFVPRVDDENYIKTLTRYHITVWEEDDDLSGPGKEIITDKACKVRTDENGKKYMIFEFPKTTVKKIGVRGRMADGGPVLHSASEIAFYNYDSLDDEIKALFGDDAFTTLASGVTQNDIDAIKAKLDSKDSYYVDSAIFKEELALAEALLAKDNSKLGMIKEGLVSIDASGDAKRINDWSPLGIVGFAGKKMVVYADIPEGEKVELIPTQYYSEANSLSGNVIELTKGRNIIDITKIGSLKETAGGSFYYRYTGQKGSQIKLQIRSINNSVVEIPTLELYDWYELSEGQRKEKIGQYIDDLTAYQTKINTLKDKETNPLNSTEISGRNILLSLPADQVFAGITGAASTKDAQIEKLYNNMLAWEEVTEVVHTTYGLDNPLSVLKSRQNIRYMRMFGKAFMYAAGSYIGVGYGSTSALVQGKPTSTLGENTTNSLFGWGIAHEIGHNMDRLGKAEITNNIYSLMLQTYDGKDNTLQSRLELSNKYEDIYKKVAIGDKGMANDVFTQLGMYWQLHLAYDNGEKDTENGPLNFYNQLFKVYDSGEVNAFSGDDKFAVAASIVAKKDLTEFFTKWGANLSDAAKAAMKEYASEERKIQYLTDESRRYRLSGGTGIQNMEITAIASVEETPTGESNANKVEITITPNSSIEAKDLLGYEIFRDGKQIAFITGTTYEDVLGSANNKAFKYEVRAIDALGNIINKGENDGKVNAGTIRIEHDNVIDKDLYNIKFVKEDTVVDSDSAVTTESAIVITFDKQMPVTGIRVKDKTGSNLPEGMFTIEVSRTGEEDYSIAKESNFSENSAVDTSKFITYFNKPGVSSQDTRIWTYDADTIRITGENIDEAFFNQFDVEPLSYPGDNVAFEDYKVGIMGQDYNYDDGDGISTIKEGTLVILGSYRGDPLYNTINILGKYAEVTGENDEITYTERPINGELLMFAEVPEDGETSDISDGFFLFIPEIQGEAEGGIQHGAEQLSLLPTQMMAQMKRYDDISHTGTPRVTSTTLWYTTPSYDSMPEIILNQVEISLMQEGMYEKN